MEIWERYILEPRSPYSNRGNSANCYLVVYDTLIQDYVKQEGSRTYIKFKDSKKAFDFLENGGEINV